MVYHGIPDYPTLRFIARLTELDLKVVRYWFHCRANYDGIMHSANTAPGEGNGTIRMPSIENYRELDKFSSSMLEEHRKQERKQQPQAQETSTSSSKATPRPAKSTRAILPVEMSGTVIPKDPKRAAGIPSPGTSESNAEGSNSTVQRMAKAPKTVAIRIKGTDAQKPSHRQSTTAAVASQVLDKGPTTGRQRGRVRVAKAETKDEPTVGTSDGGTGQMKEEKPPRKRDGKRTRNRAGVTKHHFSLMSDDEDGAANTSVANHDASERDEHRNTDSCSLFIRLPRLVDDVADHPLSSTGDTAALEKVREGASTGSRLTGGPESLAVIGNDKDDHNNVTVIATQPEEDETKAADKGENKFLKRGDVRESKPFDLSAGIIIGDGTDHELSLINEQEESSEEEYGILGHGPIIPIKQVPPKSPGKGKPKKTAGHTGGPHTQLEAARKTALQVQQAGDKDRRKPTKANGPNATADQMFSLDGPGEEQVFVESSPQQSGGAATAQERGQRMFLVAVELKERRTERRQGEMEEQSLTHADMDIDVAQKRPARWQPSFNTPHGSGDVSIPTAESPTEQPNRDIGGSRSKPRVDDEKLDAVLGKISWRDEFAAIKAIKKPRATNQTFGDEGASYFQGSHNTSPIPARHSVSMPIESSGTPRLCASQLLQVEIAY